MQQDPMRLDARTVIVAGAAGGGIGTAVVRRIALAGARVVAVDRNADALARDIGPLQSEGLDIVALCADVLDAASIEPMLERARSADCPLRGLVTVVGGAPPATWAPAHRLAREHWHAQLALNLDSMFFVTQAVAAELVATGRPGSLVSITSLNGVTSSPYNVGYGAAKAAIHSVVETMACELAQHAIRVNAIAPGPVATPAARLGADPARIRRGIPMARQATPEEMAGPAQFLLSDAASYVTGQCLVADGGCSVRWGHLDENNLPMFLKAESARAALDA